MSTSFYIITHKLQSKQQKIIQDFAKLDNSKLKRKSRSKEWGNR